MSGGEPWREEGGRYLYHYTEAQLACEIGESEIYEVGGGARFGVGLYATDLAPAEASAEEIIAVCFEGVAASNALTGVLVLLADDPRQPFEPIEGEIRVFRIPAEEVGELIAVDGLLVAVGTRTVGGEWSIDAWP